MCPRFCDVLNWYLEKENTPDLCRQNLLHDEKLLSIKTHDELFATVYVLVENEDISLNKFFWMAISALLATGGDEFEKIFSFACSFYNVLLQMF